MVLAGYLFLILQGDTMKPTVLCVLISAFCAFAAAPVAAKDPQPDESQRPPWAQTPSPDQVPEPVPWLLIAPSVPVPLPAELKKTGWQLTRLKTGNEQRIVGVDDYTGRQPDEVIVVSNGKVGRYEEQPGGWKAWVYASLQFRVYNGVDDVKAFLAQRDAAAADPARRQQQGAPTTVFYAGPHEVVLLAETSGFSAELAPIKAWLRERIAAATSAAPSTNAAH